MSKYFQALRRLQVSTSIAPTGPDDSQLKDLTFDSLPITDRGLPFPALPLAGRQVAFARLLDFIRARVQSSHQPALVIAGTSELESVSPIVRGLAQYAENQGVVLQVQILKSGTMEAAKIPHQTVLRANHPGSTPPLTIIQGPPISASVEAALKGAECAGLLLVVEPQTTRKEDLKSAVAKAKLANCTLLGAVSVESKKSQPAWLKKILASPDR